MRCSINSGLARKSNNSYSIMGFGDAAIVWLLLVAIWSGLVDAARPRAQRERANPYLVSPPGRLPDDNVRKPVEDLGERNFTLRHIYHHGSHDYPNLHRYLDIHEGAQLLIRDEEGKSSQLGAERLRARVSSHTVQRMSDRSKAATDRLFDYAAIHGEAMSLPLSAWTIDDIPGPNFTDKSTVITFAKMAANAYVEEPWTGKWEDVKGGFNYTDDFGWESDGLRGHIFADETNKTVVIGLKGTSMAVFDGAETTGNDKLNDNLFGSCCCGRGGQYMWKPVCDCMTDTYTCNNTCLVKSLREKSHYYFAARDLYHNVTERYPGADVWMSGHSLGGVVSTLLGLTYGLPVMTYEAFPDALAASRLGLPTPPGYRIGAHQSRPDLAIHHYGHTADPVFMGTCDTASSLCTIAGYAFQSQCHTGKRCAYDTVGDLGWRVSVGTHRINSVIPDVLEKYDEVAACEEDAECQDCFNWKFYESNGTESTSSSSSSSTYSRTRTETCKTPGWWGCLDETTTTGSESSTTSSSSSSTTCETPGWFGCKDPTTTTSTTSSSPAVSSPDASPAPTITTTSSRPTSSSLPPSSSSSTCKTPGWFGCNDETTTSATPQPSSTAPPTASTSHSCTSKQWFGLICVDPSPVTSSSAPPSSTASGKHCVRWSWTGRCEEWSDSVSEDGSESDGWKTDL